MITAVMVLNIHDRNVDVGLFIQEVLRKLIPYKQLFPFNLVV